jgi:hypothetical protein
MRVKITTFDGSVVISENGKYLDYYKEPLQNLGDVKIKLSQGDLFTFVYIKVVPASSAGGGGDMPPSITLKSLPTAYVGEEYYVRIDCSDLDAEFWEYYNPGKANDLGKTGLILTQHGELEGTPEKEGSYTFWIQAIGEGGEDYKAYTLTVKAADQQPTDPAEQPTDPAKTDEPKTDKPADTAPTVDGNEDGDSSIWLFVGMGLGILVAGAAVAIVLLLKKKLPGNS